MVVQKNGVRAKGLQKVLGLGSYQTAWPWLYKFITFVTNRPLDRRRDYYIILMKSSK